VVTLTLNWPAAHWVLDSGGRLQIDHTLHFNIPLSSSTTYCPLQDGFIHDSGPQDGSAAPFLHDRPKLTMQVFEPPPRPPDLLWPFVRLDYLPDPTQRVEMRARRADSAARPLSNTAIALRHTPQAMMNTTDTNPSTEMPATRIAQQGSNQLSLETPRNGAGKCFIPTTHTILHWTIHINHADGQSTSSRRSTRWSTGHDRAPFGR
jgi:hypothetical protein